MKWQREVGLLLGGVCRFKCNKWLTEGDIVYVHRRLHEQYASKPGFVWSR